MIVLFGVLGIAVVGVVAVLLSRPRPLLADDPVPVRPAVVPGPGPHEPAQLAADLAALRFPVALRGYRMADVDAYLAAISAALTAMQVPADQEHPQAAEDDAPDTAVEATEAVPAMSSDSPAAPATAADQAEFRLPTPIAPPQVATDAAPVGDAAVGEPDPAVTK